MPNPKTLQIFCAGRHTSSTGEARDWDAEDLRQIAETYDPARFKAPLFVARTAGHDTGAIPDESLVSSELAHGYPDRLRVVGNQLQAEFTKVSKQVKDWIDDHRLFALSPSFYRPESPGNPTPGKWHLRHIALLGKSAPAVKGMKSPAFEVKPLEEGDDLFTTQVMGFSDNSSDRPDSLSFMASGLPDLAQKIREWIIESKSVDAANQILPQEFLNELRLQSEAARYPIEDLQEMYRALSDRLMEVEMDLYRRDAEANEMNQFTQSSDSPDEETMTNPKTDPKTSPDPKDAPAPKLPPGFAEQFAELQQTLTTLKSQVAEAKTEAEANKAKAASFEEQLRAQQLETARERARARRQEIDSFVDSLTTGDAPKLPIAQAQAWKQVLGAIPDNQEFDFVEGDATRKTSVRKEIQDLLSSLSPIVVGGEIANPSSAPAFSAQKTGVRPVEGYVLDPESSAIFNKAMSYCESKGWDPDDPDKFTIAVDAIERGAA